MNHRFPELESKSDFSDLLVWTSHSFVTGFYLSECSYELTKYQMDSYRNAVHKFCKNSFWLDMISGLISDGFSFYEKGYRERASIYLTRANVYWTRKACVEVDFLRPVSIFSTLKEFENQLAIAKINVLEEYWGKKITPKWHYLSLMQSVDAIADKIADSSVLPRVSELIEKSFLMFLAGDTVNAIPPIHLAKKYLAAGKTGDLSLIAYREAPWDIPGLPEDSRFYG